MADIDRKEELADFMTLAEVAQYLRVAEKTIFRMIHRGEIPCVRIGSQWRFERSAITGWLESKTGKKTQHELIRLIESDTPIVPVSRLTQKEFIITDMKPGTKKEILEQLVKPLRDRGIVDDGEELIRKLLQREKMASTALWKGIAFPHVRNPREIKIRQPLLVFGMCRKGTDFESIDGDKTFLFCLLCINSMTAHLRVLARLAECFKSGDLLKRFLDAESPDEFLGILIRIEKNCPRHDSNV
ncbi:MAG: PTS sugar transporter subunit IIA [Spirochaetales bacterium]|nr:PTS sugar transporter subunit IIA [Spirochaetales bacterium]